MLTSCKRKPAYVDEDKMPFGKYINISMMHVPAKYLVWLYHELKRDGVDKIDLHALQNPADRVAFEQRIKVFNYIWNSQDGIAEEICEKFP